MAIFGKKGHHLNAFGRCLLDDASYQGFRHSSFRQHVLYVFTIWVYVKHVAAVLGNFWPKGHYLNKLGYSPLGDSTSRL